jgi:glutaredoxin
MNKNLLLTLTALLTLTYAFAQEVPLEIEEERKANRLFLNVVNKNLQDFDVAITVEGTGFRQRKGVPRKVRVPATSKVNLISLVIERGKTPQYTYKLDVTDSLSRRVIKKDYELIKIRPKKNITLYLTEKCQTCDTIVAALDKSPYIYKTLSVSENEAVRTQLEKAFVGASVPLAEMENPVVMLDGKMYIHIASYEDLMMRVEEEGEPKPIEE